MFHWEYLVSNSLTIPDITQTVISISEIPMLRLQQCNCQQQLGLKSAKSMNSKKRFHNQRGFESAVSLVYIFSLLPCQLPFRTKHLGKEINICKCSWNIPINQLSFHFSERKQHNCFRFLSKFFSWFLRKKSDSIMQDIVCRESTQ